MGGLVFLIVLAIFITLIVRANKNSPAGLKQRGAVDFDRLATNGLPARGLILQSYISTTRTMTVNGRRYEVRTMTLDIEVPNRPAYVVSGDFTMPRGVVEPIPGASLELMVDPKNPNHVAVLGPGGFTGPWLCVGVPPAY